MASKATRRTILAGAASAIGIIWLRDGDTDIGFGAGSTDNPVLTVFSDSVVRPDDDPGDVYQFVEFESGGQLGFGADETLDMEAAV